MHHECFKEFHLKLVPKTSAPQQPLKPIPMMLTHIQLINLHLTHNPIPQHLKNQTRKSTVHLGLTKLLHLIRITLILLAPTSSRTWSNQYIIFINHTFPTTQQHPTLTQATLAAPSTPSTVHSHGLLRSSLLLRTPVILTMETLLQ